MKSLSRHLISLLRLYDKVVLPGIGTFSLNYVGARLDDDKEDFFPPFYDLSFSQNNIISDGRLLDSYIRKEMMPPAQAEEIMNRDLAVLTRNLEEKGEFRLPGIGLLQVIDGRIVFSQDFALNPPLPVIRLKEEAPVISAPEAVKEEEKAPAPEPIVVEKRVEVIPEHYHYHRPDFYYIPVSRKLANIAASLLLVVIVGLVALMPGNSSCTTGSTASIVPITANKDVKATRESKRAQEEKAQKIKNNTVIPIEVKTEVVLDDEGEPIPGSGSLPTEPYLNSNQDAKAKYFAVVAAFKKQSEALNYVNSKKGNFEILKKTNIYLISVASAAEKSELESSMPLIRSNYPDAWIYTRP